MPSSIVCIVVVELARPGVPLAICKQWKAQRDAEVVRPGSERPLLVPEPVWEVQLWRGEPEERDWDRLVAFKIRDGWRLICHRREFVRRWTEEVADKVAFPL